MRLSVVVTIVDGHDVLDRCLSALAAQQRPPALEIIVPWDDTVAGIGALAARYPTCRFLDLGRLATTRPAASAAGQHELYDRRRAAGLAAATGDIIAVLEDRGVPDPDWAQTMARLHRDLPHAAIGGAIENGRDTYWHWAVYFCDFGRFHRPFAAGPRQWLSDINVGYKRRALEQTRGLWRDRYHETTVHWALLRDGETLYLTPDLVVRQMRVVGGVTALVAERFAWGRLFARTRVREEGLPVQMARLTLAPLLPFLLFVRIGWTQVTRGGTRMKWLSASPLVFLLLVAWSLGEAAGYATARA